MNITEMLALFSQTHLDEKNDWYSWRKINTTLLPEQVMITGTNQYFQNISLKESLHDAWLQATHDKRKEALIKYYIKDWGGIKSNHESKIKDYTHLSEENLIQKGKNGIASWSKALVVRDPSKYAIFDARVSASLNSLQIIYDIKDKTLFPVLSSRNNTVIEGNKLIKKMAANNKWVRPVNFYEYYLDLLQDIANKRNVNLSTVEMLLFAKAEVLVNEIKQKHP